ncbi:unnamed protein product [Bursaphelenchus okinawaensis]|uniref:Uncharacterized protein n=1 Tax=Bursaphelenchus okinawaensis TaxID=465554 RepID=A0A811KEW9_9BILA|nr:unnamed protein product [Bursaphelenchus okinawaensis]CAG9100790.1 unnamed protein product [Bursaphelenchus okinawaensis]
MTSYVISAVVKPAMSLEKLHGKTDLIVGGRSKTSVMYKDQRMMIFPRRMMMDINGDFKKQISRFQKIVDVVHTEARKRIRRKSGRKYNVIEKMLEEKLVEEESMEVTKEDDSEDESMVLELVDDGNQGLDSEDEENDEEEMMCDVEDDKTKYGARLTQTFEKYVKQTDLSQLKVKIVKYLVKFFLGRPFEGFLLEIWNPPCPFQVVHDLEIEEGVFVKLKLPKSPNCIMTIKPNGCVEVSRIRTVDDILVAIKCLDALKSLANKKAMREMAPAAASTASASPTSGLGASTRMVQASVAPNSVVPTARDPTRMVTNSVTPGTVMPTSRLSSSVNSNSGQSGTNLAGIAMTQNGTVMTQVGPVQQPGANMYLNGANMAQNGAVMAQGGPMQQPGPNMYPNVNMAQVGAMRQPGVNVNPNDLNMTQNGTMMAQGGILRQTGPNMYPTGSSMTPNGYDPNIYRTGPNMYPNGQNINQNGTSMMSNGYPQQYMVQNGQQTNGTQLTGPQCYSYPNVSQIPGQQPYTYPNNTAIAGHQPYIPSTSMAPIGNQVMPGTHMPQAGTQMASNGLQPQMVPSSTNMFANGTHMSSNGYHMNQHGTQLASNGTYMAQNGTHIAQSATNVYGLSGILHQPQIYQTGTSVHGNGFPIIRNGTNLVQMAQNGTTPPPNGPVMMSSSTSSPITSTNGQVHPMSQAGMLQNGHQTMVPGTSSLSTSNNEQRPLIAPTGMLPNGHQSMAPVTSLTSTSTNGQGYPMSQAGMLPNGTQMPQTRALRLVPNAYVRPDGVILQILPATNQSNIPKGPIEYKFPNGMMITPNGLHPATSRPQLRKIVPGTYICPDGTQFQVHPFDAPVQYYERTKMLWFNAAPNGSTPQTGPPGTGPQIGSGLPTTPNGTAASVNGTPTGPGLMMVPNGSFNGSQSQFPAVTVNQNGLQTPPVNQSAPQALSVNHIGPQASSADQNGPQASSVDQNGSQCSKNNEIQTPNENTKPSPKISTGPSGKFTVNDCYVVKKEDASTKPSAKDEVRNEIKDDKKRIHCGNRTYEVGMDVNVNLPENNPDVRAREFGTVRNTYSLNDEAHVPPTTDGKMFAIPEISDKEDVIEMEQEFRARMEREYDAYQNRAIEIARANGVLGPNETRLVSVPQNDTSGAQNGLPTSGQQPTTSSAQNGGNPDVNGQNNNTTPKAGPAQNPSTGTSQSATTTAQNENSSQPTNATDAAPSEETHITFRGVWFRRPVSGETEEESAARRTGNRALLTQQMIDQNGVQDYECEPVLQE